MTTYGKKDFINKLAEYKGTTKRDAEQLLSDIELVMASCVQNVGDKLQLKGFLTLEKKIRKPTNRRNLKTGEMFTTSEKVFLKAKVSEKFGEN